jgi:glycosyltransferase involved in cell wall biosynthesis
MSILLSVLIPTFDREFFLDQCLNSIIVDLAYADSFEVIISNNCSKDGTINCVNLYKKRNPMLNIKLINQSGHLSMMEHLHVIHNYAAGRFCLILGDDDLLYPYSIDFICKKILNKNFDILHLNRSIKNKDLSLIIKDKQYNLDGDIEFSSFADLVIPFGLISGVGFISSVVFKNAVSNIDNANWLESLSIYSNTYRFFSLFNNSKCIATDEKCVVHRQYNQRGDQLDVFFHEVLMNTPKCLLKLLDMKIIKPDQLCRIVEESDPAEKKYTLLPQRLYEIIYSFEEKLKTVSTKELCYLESLAQRMPSTFFSSLYSNLKNTISSR